VRAPDLCEWQHRMLKFSAVGAVGIAVQFIVLFGLVKLHIDYLIATAMAVESAIVHNFLWHQQFTWSDRDGKHWPVMVKRLFRFHLSNGVISLTGNLLMMRLLVGVLGFSVVIANGFAILACSGANFMVSDCWVFSPGRNQVLGSVGFNTSQAGLERSRINTNVRSAKGT